MDNIKIVKIESLATGELIEHAVITYADGSFTSMLKSTYETQAEQSTPNLTDQCQDLPMELLNLLSNVPWLQAITLVIVLNIIGRVILG